ncbi:peroxisomal d3,d2-enoyl-CoA isomeras-like protein [Saccharata proteae CBS 121410]|uniref:Peroxisomal d3,d2-enoyl-CoA isomeras-like protein n=1 Tax=Saccharata proteae CBS 121410 TaxID=1314787 RepID=A0A9P4HMI6_9PEZI|nr:peroxisomal d3,d2-enoyl-CoA isomeras-like protein [Saccharata proteae CBS 121410]
MDKTPEQAVTIQYKGKVAIITLDIEKKLNAMNQDRYYRLATLLNEVAARDDINITMLTGKGRFFSAGADVSISREAPPDEDVNRYWLKNFVSNNLFVTRAFYMHPKILITALNGPAVGLSAALIAFSDFIYAAPHAYLLTPFSSLGLVAEGGTSRAFVNRLGVSKANEALLMSKRITAEELLHVGFVNKIIDTGKNTDEFHSRVLAEIDDRLGAHLNGESMLKIKALIQKPERVEFDKANVEEVFGGLERFAKGIPQEEFRKLASGEKKHKL